MKIRLQKFLAECGVASRRKAEDLITAGKIRVNGKTIKELGSKVDPFEDTVQIGNKTLGKEHKGVILFHKPRNVVATLSDPEGRPCISDYLTNRFRSYYPVGRLDWETTGLLVLTNDGEMAQMLAHPKYGFERTYQVRVEGNPPNSALDKIERGVKLSDGLIAGRVRVTAVEDNTTWLEITVSEGKNRVIRRLMDKIGFPVVKLRRIKHGPFKLGKLQTGAVRRLTQKEYINARRKVMDAVQPRV